MGSTSEVLTQRGSGGCYRPAERRGVLEALVLPAGSFSSCIQFHSLGRAALHREGGSAGLSHLDSLDLSRWARLRQDSTSGIGSRARSALEMRPGRIHCSVGRRKIATSGWPCPSSTSPPGTGG